MRRTRWPEAWLICWTLGWLSSGCSALTTDDGEQGRLTFSLASDYAVGADIEDVSLVGRHPQHLHVSLTLEGEDDVDEPSEITYRLDAASSEADASKVTVTLEPGATSRPPDVTLRVDAPGTYTLRAIYKSREIDAITLQFELPSAIALDVDVREPNATELTDADGNLDPAVLDEPIEVTEGAHATFVVIPLDAAGTRLAGSLRADVSAEPQGLVVTGHSQVAAYEAGVWTVDGVIDLYFIDPGLVTVTIRDPISGARGQRTFRVSERL